MTALAVNETHRPVNLVPEDYEEVATFDSRPEPIANKTLALYEAKQRSSLRAALEASPSSRWNAEGHHTCTCDHCGARLRYVAVMKHRPTGDLIAVGETCLGNRFGRTAREFQAMRKAAALDAAQHKRLAAYNAFLDGKDELRAALEAEDAHHIVRDMQRKLRQYGSLSEKQLALVEKLDAERRNPKPAPAPETSEYVGTVGERIELPVTVEYLAGIPGGRFGPKTLYAFRTATGDKLTWFATGYEFNAAKGDGLTIRATVKAHEVYNGAKQTVVLRVTEVPDAE